MRANELRIKNWVRRRESDTNIQIEQYLLCNAELCKYQPIPLIEEWLLKFGFAERHGDKNFSAWWIGMNPVTHDWLFNIKQFKDENKFFFQNGFHTIKYVHQLQNLYFALTGEELTIGGKDETL